MNLHIRIFLFLPLIVFAACTERRQCSTPDVFTHQQPGSEAYKVALVTQLATMSHPRFYLEQYLEDGSGRFILVLVQEEGVCMKALMKLRSDSGLEGVIRTKGKGYSGAELAGLQYEAGHDAQGTQLFCKSVDRVVD